MDDTQRQDDPDLELARQRSIEESRPPASIPGHTFLRRLGGGAYGVVWLAQEDRTGKLVAVKFFPHSHELNWSLVSREVEKLAAVYTSHNIVRLLDVGWNATPPWFIMEYVENGSLAGHLATTGFPINESVRIITEICSALVDAHGAGVLHCDLKPDNVLLDSQLRVRLCDFGQARLSNEQNPSLGTLYYMAPEQAGLSTRPDARWDVYAVGALLYQMLTGNPPHRCVELQQRLQQATGLEQRMQVYFEAVRNSSPVTRHRNVAGVDRHLCEIVDSCLAFSPEDRFPNAQAVLDAFRARSRHRARRPLLVVGLVIPILLILLVLPFMVNAFSRNLQDAEEQLMRRALESDALSARLQAAALEDEIDNRLDELKALVASQPIRAELELLFGRPVPAIVAETQHAHDLPLENRPPWMQALDAAWENSQQIAQLRGRSRDTSWFLNASDGTQVWRRDYSGQSVGKNYQFRDYFHGRGLDFSPKQVPSTVAPITTPHISIAYKSTTTGRWSVALSVPVKDKAGNVVGILSRSAHLGDLQQRLRGAMDEAVTGTGKDDSGTRVERLIALAELRKEAGEQQLRLLDHPSLSETFLRAAERDDRDEEMLQKLTLGNDVVEQIVAGDNGQKQIRELRLRSYRDPAGNIGPEQTNSYAKEWIAALAPVRKTGATGWIVIVQEERNQVLAPVQQMAHQALRQGLAALFAAILGIAFVWGIVWGVVLRTHSRTADSG